MTDTERKQAFLEYKIIFPIPINFVIHVCYFVISVIPVLIRNDELYTAMLAIQASFHLCSFTGYPFIIWLANSAHSTLGDTSARVDKSHNTIDVEPFVILGNIILSWLGVVYLTVSEPVTVLSSDEDFGIIFSLILPSLIGSGLFVWGIYEAYNRFSDWYTRKTENVIILYHVHTKAHTC